MCSPMARPAFFYSPPAAGLGLLFCCPAVLCDYFRLCRTVALQGRRRSVCLEGVPPVLLHGTGRNFFARPKRCPLLDVSHSVYIRNSLLDGGVRAGHSIDQGPSQTPFLRATHISQNVMSVLVCLARRTPPLSLLSLLSVGFCAACPVLSVRSSLLFPLPR